MYKSIQGYFGFGKTSVLFDDITQLVSSNECSVSDILILTVSKAQDEYIRKNLDFYSLIKDIHVLRTDELCLKILNISHEKILGSYLCSALIEKICEESFSSDKSLPVLLKSPVFFDDLNQLFSSFKKNAITSDSLFEALESIRISETDKKRLNIIFEVFEKYNNSLKSLGYVDYYDCIKESLEYVKKEKIKKYKYVFVDNKNFMFPLLKELTEILSENVCIYEDIIFSSKKNISSLKMPLSQISQRAFYVLNKYSHNLMYDVETEQTDKVKYLEFEGFNDEISYIAKDIKNKLSKGYSLSDFAVVIRNSQEKLYMAELFKSYDLPLNIEFCSEEFKNFKIRLMRYFNICELCKKFGIDKISKEVFSNFGIISKIQTEIYSEEMNLYIENLLADIFGDIYKKDRFISLHTRSKDSFLLNTVYKNLDILSDADKASFLSEIKHINTIYNYFKNNNFAAAIKYIYDTQNYSDKACKELIGTVYALDKLYSGINKKIEYSTIVRLLEELIVKQTDIEDSVRILTFSDLSQDFRCVYIPSLSENNIPMSSKEFYFISHEGNKKFSDKLREKYSDFSYLIENKEVLFKKELQNFCFAMSCAKDNLILSYHRYEGKKTVQPSSFFFSLSEMDSKNFFKTDSYSEENKLNIKDKNTGFIKGKKVFSKEEILKLNASAIDTYLSCPRKYFFKNILNLKEQKSFQASYGSVVHFILEIFNTKCLENYTKQKILELTEVLFDAKNSPSKASDIGFDDFAISLISSTDNLSLEEMKKNFLAAVEEMDQSGFFESSPDCAVCEKNFEYTLPGAENVLINGKIDAILKKDGVFSVVDYKTGAYKKSLAYYLSDYGLNFEGDTRQYKGVFSENNIKNYQYQIPLYYLGIQNSIELKDFKNKISFLSLKYIRPSIAGDGYKEDKISSHTIEEKKEKLIANLQTTVIDKIRNTVTFEKTGEKRKCMNCSYSFLCEEGGSDDTEE